MIVPLSIELRPGEKLFINGAVIANGDDRTHLQVLNDAAILRERDILTEAVADTPCKRAYWLVQSMYMDPSGRQEYMRHYHELSGEIMKAAPSTARNFLDISDGILSDDLYAALKAAKKLIDYEQELMNHARQSP